MCGGTGSARKQYDGGPGLSPRVRGNLHPRYPDVLVFGSIPACAGEPVSAREPWLCPWVYPRVCGGTTLSDDDPRSVSGLSPRVRGNPLHLGVAPDSLRSIPACAGEPRTPHALRSARWVYPRVCGGTANGVRHDEAGRGLSPRVRGNPRPYRGRRPSLGSIPACAGEPTPPRTIGAYMWVYPRVCGGTPRTSSSGTSPLGLSPRVRGNPSSPIAPRRRDWSIPACAGEPASGIGTKWCMWVYPRVCGGTSAGTWMFVALTVYPRVCGGTPMPPVCPAGITGLSPRVRGNHPEQLRRHDHPRSIPACAGEPFRRLVEDTRPTVYPRVCGGTRDAARFFAHQYGLSPRVRGNPTRKIRDTKRIRSIPACAGEPAMASVLASAPSVYPRVCGGTSP